MKFLKIVMAATLLFSCSLTAMAATLQGVQMKAASNSETEVSQLEQEFLLAWNQGDSEHAASLFAENGVRVGASGDISRGRGEIQAAFQRLLNGPMKGAQAACNFTVRLISEDVALVEGPLTIVPPNGAPAMQGYALDIWKKTQDTWAIIEAHPKFFPPRH